MKKQQAKKGQAPLPSTMTSPHSARSGKILAKERISHFTWTWFACTMSTGAVAVVLGKTPYRFKGLDTIGKIFFILDLILLISFSTLLSIRFGMRPRVAIRSLHHPAEALFFGAFWVSIALVLNCMEIYGGTSTGGWLTRVLEICFWLYCACAFCVGGKSPTNPDPGQQTFCEVTRALFLKPLRTMFRLGPSRRPSLSHWAADHPHPVLCPFLS